MVNYFKIRVPQVVVYEYYIEIVPGSDKPVSFGNDRGRGRGRGNFRGQQQQQQQNWRQPRPEFLPKYSSGQFPRGNFPQQQQLPPPPPPPPMQKKFKPIEGKMKKEVSNDYNRAVLAKLREDNRTVPSTIYQPGQLFYDGSKNGIEYVYDGVTKLLHSQTTRWIEHQ